MVMIKPLEEYSVFPYIAWGVFIAFAFFTYTLVDRLNDTVSSLNTHTVQTENSIP